MKENRYKIEIINFRSQVILMFNTAEKRQKMVDEIEITLNNSKDFIKYLDKSDEIIFTKEYLKNSLIKIPKVE